MTWLAVSGRPHPAVVRLNNAPTVGFERYVGGKTTHRLLNGLWTMDLVTSPADNIFSPARR